MGPWAFGENGKSRFPMPGGGMVPGEYIVTINRPEDKPSRTQQIKNPDGTSQKLDLYEAQRSSKDAVQRSLRV